jgi:hypothetical protein
LENLDKGKRSICKTIVSKKSSQQQHPHRCSSSRIGLAARSGGHREGNEQASLSAEEIRVRACEARMPSALKN